MKKRALYFIIVLALVVCMAVPTTTPVMASIIDAAKHPIPLLPNIYRVGDTIYYEMRVSNPIGNNASNYLTRIWDTLPNGTVIDFLGPSETLIQAPGNTTTFYGNYTVAAIDVVWLPGPGYYGVTNHFEAEGVNSDGAGVYVHRTAISQVIQPDIDIEKYTNGQDADSPTGPLIEVGGNVTWTYVVTNTGDSDLDPVVVVDDNGTPGNMGDDFNPAYTGGDDGDGILNPSEVWYYAHNGTAVAGQYANNATATGTPPVGDPVSDSDPSHYLGSEVGIDIEKHTNGQDADSPTGPHIVAGGSVTWTYNVTNTGALNLTGILVTDDHLGVTPVYISGDNGDGILNPGESWIYQATGVAATGQYANIGTVVGYYGTLQVTDSDPSHYLGLGPSIDIEKYVSVDGGVTWDPADSAPGPSAVVGENIKFMVTVCNNGSAPLTNIFVSDTDFTFTGVLTSLAVGACDNSSVVTVAAVAGQHYDLATVTGEADGVPVTASDPAYYTGLTSGISIEKYVSVDGGVTWDPADSPPGPTVLVGENVSFYVSVCNIGTANLTNVLVSDTDFTFTGVVTSLAVGACDNSTILTTTAVAGQQWDVANVTAQADGIPVFDEDPAYYFGSPPVPAIDIEKHTNGVDADTAPGPHISVNSTVTWTYIVTNIGTANLTDIVVTDDKLGLIGTIPSLPVSATETLYAYGTAVAGQYANNATAVGYYGVVEVTDWDPSHYYNYPATVVGWETYPVSKLRLLLPWIASLAAIIGGASLLVLRRRRLM